MIEVYSQMQSKTAIYLQFFLDDETDLHHWLILAMENEEMQGVFRQVRIIVRIIVDVRVQVLYNWIREGRAPSPTFLLVR